MKNIKLVYVNGDYTIYRIIVQFGKLNSKQTQSIWRI